MTEALLAKYRIRLISLLFFYFSMCENQLFKVFFVFFCVKKVFVLFFLLLLHPEIDGAIAQ